ncbi:MAG: nuclease-related domain-containing protein [Nostoc sp.]
MATLIPSFNSCSMRMTPGERRLGQRLEEKLEDDYLLWYDVPLGKKQLHLDFIVLHPSRGLFILEVKDWKLDTIQNINPSTVTLLKESDRSPQSSEETAIAHANISRSVACRRRSYCHTCAVPLRGSKLRAASPRVGHRPSKVESEKILRHSEGLTTDHTN